MADCHQRERGAKNRVVETVVGTCLYLLVWSCMLTAQDVEKYM
jgi:hypothetical protein